MTDETDKTENEASEPAAEKDESTEETPTPTKAAESAPEPVVSEEEDPDRIPVKRQWVTVRGSSLDARVGDGLLDKVGRDLKSFVGKPRAVALITTPETPSEVEVAVRHSLTDAGFLVTSMSVGSGPEAATMESATALLEDFAKAGITGDDVACVVGDAYAASVACFACRCWCGGVALDEVPLDAASASFVGPTPLPLDLPGCKGLVTQSAAARFFHVDMGLLSLDPADERVLLARALFATTAIADSDKAFERLWDRTPQLTEGDRATYAAQIADCLKSRGKIVSSTSIAVRQSIDYGRTFTCALRSLVPASVPTSSIIAESMRFAGRLSVAQDELSIDDMLTQDELLDRLELGGVECAVDPDALVAALKAERFRRSNKFMLELPRKLGRVRLGSVDDDLLAEHVGAWCAARPEAAVE